MDYQTALELAQAIELDGCDRSARVVWDGPGRYYVRWTDRRTGETGAIERLDQAAGRKGE